MLYEAGSIGRIKEFGSTQITQEVKTKALKAGLHCQSNSLLPIYINQALQLIHHSNSEQSVLFALQLSAFGKKLKGLPFSQHRQVQRPHFGEVSLQNTEGKKVIIR